jgi:hypothetical protein
MTPAEWEALRDAFKATKHRLAATVAHVHASGESLDGSHVVRRAIEDFIAARDAYFDAEN